MSALPFHTKKFKEICRRNDVLKIGVFGSTAREEDNQESDIDLIVQFSKKKSLLAHIRLERELTELMGREVDLLTEPAISPYLRDRIMNDVKVVYEST